MVSRKAESSSGIPSDPVLRCDSYSKFKRALADSGCKRCGLAASRTRIVVDRGNPQARAIAIGEGPGAEEDRQGRVFVGRAGKLLDELMDEAGLDPERDFLIINLVKCRPPGNRVPGKAEVEACAPYLRRQIELVRPRLLALLGASAARHFLPEELLAHGISRIAGRFFDRPDLPGMQVFLLFHPAFILRNPKKRGVMIEHLAALRDRLRAILREEIAFN